MATAVTPGAGDKLKQRDNLRSRRRLALAQPARLVGPPAGTANGRSAINNIYHDKHVYFADTPGSQRSSTSTNEPVDVIAPHDTPVEQSSTKGNLLPSTQTLPTTAHCLTQSIITKQDEESFVESDSSSKRSSMPFHLPKRILSFGNKSALYAEGKSDRQSNLGFAPPWSTRRKSPDTQPDLNEDTFSRPLTPLKSANFPSASTSIQPSAVSFFSFKAHNRRVSAPNPRMRTQPYDAPYFALPPTNATFDIRKSRQMFRESLIDSNIEHVSEDNRGRLLQSPKQSLIKRRSASEGWNNGRRPTSLL
ncbi:hypothetical protein C0992_004983 [Termitomyces sp. T32_za158]|nr:hypothetical protein C0992_004983 [Termitomyces sp. T32_za158]